MGASKEHRLDLDEPELGLQTQSLGTFTTVDQIPLRIEMDGNRGWAVYGAGTQNLDVCLHTGSVGGGE
jgi:hypothetical protein